MKKRIKFGERNRYPWTPQQEFYLRDRMAEMMEDDGYVDMAILAYHCGHSLSSCDYKARQLGLKFVLRNPSEDYVRNAGRQKKCDMRTLPIIKGREVKYEDVEYLT